MGDWVISCIWKTKNPLYFYDIFSYFRSRIIGALRISALDKWNWFFEVPFHSALYFSALKRETLRFHCSKVWQNNGIPLAWHSHPHCFINIWFLWNWTCTHWVSLWEISFLFPIKHLHFPNCSAPLILKEEYEAKWRHLVVKKLQLFLNKLNL